MYKESVSLQYSESLSLYHTDIHAPGEMLKAQRISTMDVYQLKNVILAPRG